MGVLANGEQERFNRTARLVAWLAQQIRFAMYGAVNHGLAEAFSKQGEGPPPPEFPSVADLLKTIPGHREVED